MSALTTAFDDYRKRVDITRVRLKDVPAELKPLIMHYRQALADQLADPENDSTDSLCPNEQHNALQAVKQTFATPTTKPAGNCPRCACLGRINAYRHIQGGTCLQCNGTGNIKTA